MDANKVPYHGKDFAHPDTASDFIPLEELDVDLAAGYAGLGVSIQASGICAVDVDHCFSSPFVLGSADERAKDILGIFSGCYEEFSFSGTGLRSFFLCDGIPHDYEKTYFTKNKKTGCEFYYPEGSNRYVSITGMTINDAAIKTAPDSAIKAYLDKYLLRQKAKPCESENNQNEGYNPEELLKHYIRSDSGFQNNWFEKAPGSGSNESERDYFLVAFIYDHITKDKSKIKEIFESSPFFKSKDRRHMFKWEYHEGRYYNYLYECVSGQR